jgi:hypothetical protein
MEDCPSCGSKLEKGFIAGHQIAWTRKRGEVPITRLTGCYVAYKCRQCDLILFYLKPLPREPLLDTVPTFDMNYILKEKERTPSETEHTPKRQK